MFTLPIPVDNFFQHGTLVINPVLYASKSSKRVVFGAQSVNTDAIFAQELWFVALHLDPLHHHQWLFYQNSAILMRAHIH